MNDSLLVAAPLMIAAIVMTVLSLPDPCAEDGTMIDNCKIDATLNSDGEIVVVPTYTQT
jgi:hypothetical protein